MLRFFCDKSRKVAKKDNVTSLIKILWSKALKRKQGEKGPTRNDYTVPGVSQQSFGQIIIELE